MARHRRTKIYTSGLLIFIICATIMLNEKMWYDSADGTKQGGLKKVKQMQGSSTNKTRKPLHNRGRTPYLVWLVWLVWLPLIPPIIIARFLSHAPLPNLIISLAGIALFFGIYLWASWRHIHRLVIDPKPPADVTDWLVTLMLTILSVVLTLVNGKEWSILFYFTSGDAGARLPTVRAIQVTGALLPLLVIVGLLLHLDWLAIGQEVLFIVVICGISLTIIRAITTSWELHDAREELARLAVTTERTRIARDLHDLLGHNLSLIILKSELAGRLIDVAPERARVEIGDVEQAARTTLQEVREVVASYRQPTLLNELHSARELLVAADIGYRFEGDGNAEETLPTAIESVLAWTVREGVTNIIRHSRAHHCLIRMTREQHSVQVEVIDDGIGTSPSEAQPQGAVFPEGSGKGGHGLHGLGERVNALGGRLKAGPNAGGGFRLAVSVPLAYKTGSPGTGTV
jgi:two-component system sensor histidine kinase DesK